MVKLIVLVYFMLFDFYLYLVACSFGVWYYFRILGCMVWVCIRVLLLGVGCCCCSCLLVFVDDGCIVAFAFWWVVVDV